MRKIDCVCIQNVSVNHKSQKECRTIKKNYSQNIAVKEKQMQHTENRML